MLLAEIHGKYDPSVRDNEDYLTSSVFSHLRYVAPGPFWQELLSRAMTVAINGMEQSLCSIVGDNFVPGVYERLEVHFWPRAVGLGEPELAICFTGGKQEPLVLLVEVKLWSPKSGYGEHDQLMRYLRIADFIDLLKPAAPPNATAVVLYLTPRDSLIEVQDSLEQAGDTDRNRRRLFRLQWQDMIEAIDAIFLSESLFNQQILADVRDFLRVRQLEYFRGFRTPVDVSQLEAGCGSFYSPQGIFDGFQRAPSLSKVAIVRGEW